jgi:hypothetical protein
VACQMEEVSNPMEELKACKQIFKNAGVAGFMEGFNPWRAADDRFLQTLQRVPILRLKPVSIANGPTDAGGWHWVTLALLGVALLLKFL